jgi:hypothetical protein
MLTSYSLRCKSNFATEPPSEGDVGEWAELRVNAQSIRVYETRTFDQTGWKKAMSQTTAVETICNEVGYIPL